MFAFRHARLSIHRWNGLFAVASLVIAAEVMGPCSIASSQESPITYTEHVLPLLRKNCLACHYEKISEGGLSLESLAALRQGGDSGDTINLEEPSASLLITRALGTVDSIMPPEDNSVGAVPFDSEEIAILEKWIASGAGDAVPAETMLPQWQSLPASLRSIYSMAISPLDSTLAVGRGNQIELINSLTGSPVSLLTDPSLVPPANSNPQLHPSQLDFVNALVFHPSGQWLASGDFQSVRIWRPLKTPTVFSTGANDVQSSLLHSLVHQSIAQSHAVPGEEERQRAATFDLSGSPLQKLYLNQDRRLAITVAENQSLRLWNWVDGQLIAQLADEHSMTIRRSQRARDIARQKAHAEFVTGLIPAGEESAKKEEEARAKAEETHKKQEEDVVAKQTKLNEALAALQAAETGTESITEEQRAALKKTINEAETAVTEAVKQSMSTAQALAASTDTRDRAHQALQQLKDESAAENAALAQMESSILTAPSVPVVDVSFQQASTEFVVAFADGHISQFSTTDGRYLNSYLGGPTVPYQVTFSGKDWIVAMNPGVDPGMSDDGLMAWKVTPSWELAQVIGNPNGPSPFSDRVTALDFSPDGTKLVVGCGEPSRLGEVHVIDTTSWTVLQSWTEMHSDSVLAVRVSPDGRYLASSAADRQIRIVDFPAGTNQRTLEGHTHHVLSIAWQDDGRRLASASADKTIKIWNTRSGESERTINVGAKEVTSLAFAGTSTQLVATSGDGAVRLYNAADGALLRTFSSSASFQHSAAVSYSGDRVAAGGDDGITRLWKLEAPELIFSRP